MNTNLIQNSHKYFAYDQTSQYMSLMIVSIDRVPFEDCEYLQQSYKNTSPNPKQEKGQKASN